MLDWHGPTLVGLKKSYTKYADQEAPQGWSPRGWRKTKGKGQELVSKKDEKVEWTRLGGDHI